jgi:hypothetical protein
MTTADDRPPAGTAPGLFVPVPDGAEDLGPWALDELSVRLGIDDNWAVREERGVTWWPGPLAQRAWADPPLRTPAGVVCRIHVETAILRNVPVSDRSLELLAAANLEAVLSGFALDADGILSVHNAVHLHAEAPEEIEELAAAAALQVSITLGSTPALHAALGGDIAESSHPERGARPDIAAVAGAGKAIAAPGQDEPPFTASDFTAVERQGGRLWVVALAKGRGINAEIPFPAPDARSRAASRIVLPGSDPAPAGSRPTTALLQVTAEERHRDLGSGLLVLLRLPVTGEPSVVARAANALNLAERGESAGLPLLGAWCSVQGGLVFSLFTPTGLCPTDPPEARQAIILERAVWMLGRAMWAAEEVERRQLVPRRRASGIILPGGTPVPRPGGPLQ